MVVSANGRVRPRVSRSLARARWREYRRFLQAAREKDYEIVALEDWVGAAAVLSAAPMLVLRHDVDQDPRSALAMAAVERELGVRSSWYFRWRTAHPVVIRELRGMGCSVGLHYETLSREVLARGMGPDDDLRGLVIECRELLRREIAAFGARFGPIRSVAPHGDSRLPFVRNALLLRDEDCRSYGVEFDGNEAMRGRKLAHWLTDRSLPEGGWKDRLDPAAELFQRRLSPILAIVHPNNWASGASLWRDRVLARLLPDPQARGPRRPIRTGSDEPAL